MKYVEQLSKVWDTNIKETLNMLASEIFQWPDYGWEGDCSLSKENYEYAAKTFLEIEGEL